MSSIEDRPGTDLRTQDIDPWNVAQEVGLEWNRDEFRHLLRRQPECFALDFDDDRAELRVDIHRHVPKLVDTEEEQHCGSDRQKNAEPQAPVDYSAYHLLRS